MKLKLLLETFGRIFKYMLHFVLFAQYQLPSHALLLKDKEQCHNPSKSVCIAEEQLIGKVLSDPPCVHRHMIVPIRCQWWSNDAMSQQSSMGTN